MMNTLNSYTEMLREIQAYICKFKYPVLSITVDSEYYKRLENYAPLIKEPGIHRMYIYHASGRVEIKEKNNE